ncbi:MAG: hypothetical protein ACYCWW_20590 [Deltaproteobacteria bacterium]
MGKVGQHEARKGSRARVTPKKATSSKLPHRTYAKAAIEYGCGDSALKGLERKAFEAHLSAGCAECATNVALWRSIWPDAAEALRPRRAADLWTPAERDASIADLMRRFGGKKSGAYSVAMYDEVRRRLEKHRAGLGSTATAPAKRRAKRAKA